jgi:hypothetical protein
VLGIGLASPGSLAARALCDIGSPYMMYPGRILPRHRKEVIALLELILMAPVASSLEPGTVASFRICPLGLDPWLSINRFCELSSIYSVNSLARVFYCLQLRPWQVQLIIFIFASLY